MDVEVGCLYRTVLDTEVMLSKLLIICKNGEGSPAAFDGSSEKRTCLDCATMDFFQLSQARIRNWGCFPGIWKRQEMLSALTYGYVRVEAWKLRVKLGMLLCRWVSYSQGLSVCGYQGGGLRLAPLFRLGEVPRTAKALRMESEA